ncbi:MAG: hypothetical protein AB1814_14410 [Thermodesulfobacteriota bacterium]
MSLTPFRPALLGVLCLALLLPGLAGAAEPAIPGDVIYRQQHPGQRLNISPSEFNFLVDNLVGVLAIASQPSFRERHMLFSGLRLDSISGTPGDFTVRVHKQQARVRMSRPGAKEVLYQADVKLEKLKLSITGQAWVLLRLSYDDPAAKSLTMDLTVAFKPSSAILAAALKPMLAAFKAEMDRISGRVLLMADDFLKVYRAELAGSFGQRALLAQAAVLIDQNRQMQRELQARGQGEASAPGERPLDWRGWLLALGLLLAALAAGGALGLWWSRRRSPDAAQAVELRRQLEEERARAHELSQALAQHQTRGQRLAELAAEAASEG